MSQYKRVCPFLKSACIECPVYRGRHTNLWAGHLTIGPSVDPFNGKGSDTIAALDAFYHEAVSPRITDEAQGNLRK